MSETTPNRRPEELSAGSPGKAIEHGLSSERRERANVEDKQCCY
jgi:hypothetical protein